MTRDDAFIELLTTGVAPEDAKELLDAIERSPRPLRTPKPLADPLPHQPVWALMNRPYGIVTGFKRMHACELHDDNFDLHTWVENGL